MHAFVLQDWTTIRAASGVNTITQEEGGWLDLAPFQDVVFWIDTKESTSTPMLAFQTSPSKDDNLFLAVAPSYAMPIGGVSTPAVVSALMTAAPVPLARYLRWQITSSTSPWDATFRVLVAANAPGM
jgi:hypothetical protein